MSLILKIKETTSSKGPVTKLSNGIRYKSFGGVWNEMIQDFTSIKTYKTFFCIKVK